MYRLAARFLDIPRNEKERYAVWGLDYPFDDSEDDRLEDKTHNSKADIEKSPESIPTASKPSQTSPSPTQSTATSPGMSMPSLFHHQSSISMPAFQNIFSSSSTATASHATHNPSDVDKNHHPNKSNVSTAAASHSSGPSDPSQTTLSTATTDAVPSASSAAISGPHSASTAGSTANDTVTHNQKNPFMSLIFPTWNTAMDQSVSTINSVSTLNLFHQATPSQTNTTNTSETLKSESNQSTMSPVNESTTTNHLFSSFPWNVSMNNKSTNIFTLHQDILNPEESSTATPLSTSPNHSISPSLAPSTESKEISNDSGHETMTSESVTERATNPVTEDEISSMSEDKSSEHNLPNNLLAENLSQLANKSSSQENNQISSCASEISEEQKLLQEKFIQSKNSFDLKKAG